MRKRTILTQRPYHPLEWPSGFNGECNGNPKTTAWSEAKEETRLGVCCEGPGTEVHQAPAAIAYVVHPPSGWKSDKIAQSDILA